jgi:hypothetical protein
VINSALYREPQLLDPANHRRLRIASLADFSITKGMHGVFITATEMPQAALDFPLVFIHTGDRDANGRANISPIVLLGLSAGENLFVDGTRWDARYIPAFIRRYPFLTATLRNAGATGVMIDRAWSGFSETEGEPLFEADDKPAAALKRAIEFLEMFETEAQRTRLFCNRLLDLELLREMKADATLPDGVNLSVDGFLVVDEEKLHKLADEPVLEMHRNGMLMLLHLHLASLANMRGLVERKARRAQAAAAATATPATVG